MTTRKFRVIKYEENGKLFVLDNNTPYTLGPRRKGFIEELIEETQENLTTGNSILDEHIKGLTKKQLSIPQYLQVISQREIDQIKTPEDAINIKDTIQKRMNKNGYLRAVNSGGISMGARLRNSTPSSPFFNQIVDYCIAIGRNSYQGETNKDLIDVLSLL